MELTLSSTEHQSSFKSECVKTDINSQNVLAPKFQLFSFCCAGLPEGWCGVSLEAIGSPRSPQVGVVAKCGRERLGSIQVLERNVLKK